MSEAPTEPIPAATVIVMRERGGGEAPELLIVERAKAMRFAGGALVFPGGRIDPGDRVAGALFAGDADDMAARIAAIRESVEEAGVAVGLGLPGGAAALATLRDALDEGASMLEAVAAADAWLAPDDLVPFARWVPHHPMVRVFDTRFYLAKWQDDMPAPQVDGTENSRLFWASAAEVLAMADRGEARLIFPTRRNLERLAQFDGFESAMHDARRHPVRTVTPWIEDRDGVPHICIPDDLGYPVTAVPTDSAERA